MTLWCDKYFRDIDEAERLSMTSIDRAIIAEGLAVGMQPDRGDAIPGFADPLGARWLRFRAACARVERETTTDPELRAYLHCSACGADAEASARERSLDRMAERARERRNAA